MAILFAATVMMAFSQKRIITGKVTDSSSQPLAGVSVTVKGSERGHGNGSGWQLPDRG